MRKVDKLGICPLELFDGSTLELLSKECRRILNCGQVEEVVELIEILDGEFLDFFALFYFWLNLVIAVWIDGVEKL